MSGVLTMDDRQRLLQERLQRARTSRAAPESAIPRRVAGATASLTPLQRQLWFLQQLEPDSAAYNIPVAFGIKGELDPDLLGRAIALLAERYEVLRTCYPENDGEPVARVSKAFSPLDVREIAADEVDLQIEAEAARPFDLARDVPMRAVLWRTGSDAHVLLLVWHHIAVDGWSVALLLDALRDLYAQLLAAMDPVPSTQCLQFADVVAWRENHGGNTDGAVEAWRRHLDGAPPLLALPADRPRGAGRGNRGKIHRFRLGAGAADALAKLSEHAGATRFQVLVAALSLLHARDAGQDDVVLGTVVSRRERREIEAVPGCFVNTVALRSRIGSDSSARSLIAGVRATMTEMADHMDLPFAQLVDEIGTARQSGYSPVFQVLLSVNSFERSPFTLPGLSLEEMPVDTHTAKFDLSWAIDSADGDVTGSVTYHSGLFDVDNIERMIARFAALLRSMASDIDAPVWDLPLLGVDGVRAILSLGEGAALADGPLPDIIERFCAQVDRAPDAPALRADEQTRSYAELDRASSRIAHLLARRGAAPETRVAILLSRGPQMLEAMLGVLKAGAAYVPIDPDYPAERIAMIISDAGADHVLSESALADRAGERAILIDTDSELQTQSAERPPYQPDPDRLMYILFTSGSTGRPKGVAIQHGGYANYLSAILGRLTPATGSHFGLVTTFAADLGTTMTFGAMATGGCLHIFSRECAADPISFGEYLRANPIDYLKLVPGHFELLASMRDVSDLLPRRCIIFAGEALPVDLVRAIARAVPGIRVENHYGPTETTVAALALQAAGAGPWSIEPIGRPLPGVRCHVLNSLLEPVDPGVVGELFIGGAGVSRGYDGRPAATAAAFVPDPFSARPGARLYATGDLAKMDRDGTVHFVGRRDRQVKIRGFRIEIAEIESVLAAHPAIGDVRVVVRGDANDRRLIAYYVAAESLDAELKDWVASRLPDYMRPYAFCALDAMPLNANGKLLEAALPEPSRSSVSAGEARARSALEDRIAVAWSNVLGVGDIGLDDDFFHFGGDSFKAVRAVRELGDDVRVMDLFAHPTIARLATHLEGVSQVASSVLHRLTGPAAAGATSWVCVPFGGGSAISYLALAGELQPGEALYAVEIPGHDYARREEPLLPFAETVTLCADAIEAQVRSPLLLYGHCLGAALAVAIGIELERRGVELAGVVVGAAFPAPRLPGRIFDAISRALPTDMLMSSRSIVDGLLVMGGATGEEDPRELEFLVRNMRHDGREAEDFYTRAYRAPVGKLRARLLSVVGDKDPATEFHAEEVREWTRFAHDVSLASIPRAGHFFQKHQAAELAGIGARHAAKHVGDLIVTDADSTPHADMRTLVAFLLTTLGQIVSTIGSGLSTFALGVWIYQRSHVVTNFALLVAVGLVPGILALPFTGALADRFDRRKIMMATDAVSLAVTSLACAMAVAHQLPLAMFYILAGTASIATAFRQPAYLAAIAQLVPKRHLSRATGLVQIGSASGLILSQAFGGLLIAWFGLGTILALDVVSYSVAICTLLMVRFPNLLFHRREEPFLQEMTQGWRFILKRRGLIGLMLFFAIGNALASIVLVLVTPIVLALDDAAALGLVMASNGVGMLLGSLVMGIWGGARDRIRGLVGFVALFGVSAVILGLRPSIGFPLVGMLGIGLSTAFINAHWLALIQVKTGLELQGRVLAANQIVARSLMPLGTLAAGWLADRIFEPMLRGVSQSGNLGVVIGAGSGRGAALLVILAGLSSLALTVFGLTWRPLRRIEQDLPDAVPASEIMDKDDVQASADALIRDRVMSRAHPPSEFA